MKRNYKFSALFTISVFCLIWCYTSTSAQSYQEVRKYHYSEVNNAGTYSYLTTGTTLDTGSNNTNTSYTNISIGFNFRFNNRPGGTVYTTLGVHTNGFVWFGTGVPGAASSAPIATNGNIGGTGSIEGVISAYADYAGTLISFSNNSYIRYVTQGSAPNRKFIVEWNAYQNPNGFHGSNSTPTFRITLYEDGTATPAGYSNKIEIQHLNHTPVLIVNDYLIQIGLRGMDNSDFVALNLPKCSSNYWNNIPSSITNKNSTVSISGNCMSNYLNTASARFDFTPPNDSCRMYADFSQTGNDSGRVSFTDLSKDSSLSNPGITAWSWSFGDNSTSALQSPSHLYTYPGIYQVCLTVTNSSGCTESFCKNVTVTNLYLPPFVCTGFDEQQIPTGDFNHAFNIYGNGHPGFLNDWNVTNGSPSIYKDYNGIKAYEGNQYAILGVCDVTGDYSEGISLTYDFKQGKSYTVSMAIRTAAITGTTPLDLKLILLHNTIPFNYALLTTGCSVTPSIPSGSLIAHSVTNYNDTAWKVISFTISNVGSDYSQLWFRANRSAGGPIFTTAFLIDSLCIHETVTPPSSNSLCVAVFPQDSSFASPGQETEIFLIKAFSTSMGDSLAAIKSVIRGTTTVAYYCFDSLPNGTYYVKAALTPNASRYADYLPTYYNLDLMWSDATPLNLNSQQYITFPLIKGINTLGPGFIGGYVTQGANRLEATNDVPGDPLPGKRVLLTNDAGDGIAHVLTNSKGQYAFPGLAYGVYKIWVDELNRLCTPLSVIIDGTQDNIDNANFQINATSIKGGIALNERGIINSPFEVSILGNPAEKELRLYFNNMQEDGDVTVFNILGSKLFTANQPKESTLVRFDIRNLPAGVYLISARSGNEVRMLKFIKD